MFQIAARYLVKSPTGISERRRISIVDAVGEAHARQILRQELEHLAGFVALSAIEVDTVIGYQLVLEDTEERHFASPVTTIPVSEG